MGIIYKLTSPKGKEYIGQTTKTFDVRMYNHKSASGNLNKKDGCCALNNAIRKHGWSNFHKEIILECEDNELDFYESYFIAEYNTLAPAGYNLISGGNSNKIYSEITKEKIRQSAFKRDTSVYRKSEITKDWPKYLGLFNGFPRIAKHPNCRCKSFNDKNKSFDENLEDALGFLELLNRGEVKVEIQKSDRPKGLQECKGGFRVHIRNKHGSTVTKMFTNQSVPLIERRKQAEDYLKLLIENNI